MFIDNLILSIKKLSNPTVVGLDPTLDFIPTFIKEKVEKDTADKFLQASLAITIFNIKIIDAISDIVPCIKPQMAHYEAYGIPGLIALKDTITYAKSKGMQVILDAKRGDIGSTAKAYARAYLSALNYKDKRSDDQIYADALTVNAYLGVDGILPFLEYCNDKVYEKGLFVLVKTSNPSSSQIQDLKLLDGTMVYEQMGALVSEWGQDKKGEFGYSNVGAVIGATYPNEAKKMRKVLKNAYILVPGYGAQGGTAEDAAMAFNDDGLGAIVNSSRGIMCAYKSDLWKDTFNEKSFAEAARAESIRMRDDINNALSKMIR